MLKQGLRGGVQEQQQQRYHHHRFGVRPCPLWPECPKKLWRPKGIAEVVSLYVKTLARIVESILDKLGMNEETEFAQNAKH